MAISSFPGLMNTAKLSILGFLAGVLSFLTLILIIYLGLMILALFFTIPQALIEARATETLSANGSASELIWGSLVGSFQNLLKGLWEAGPGFLVGGFLGLIAAWAYHLVLAVRVERAWPASFLCLVILASISFITWANILREETALRLAEFPELYQWRDLLLGSSATTVLVALIFTVTIIYPFWVGWRWWYRFMAGRLFTLQPEPEPRSGSNLQPTALAEHLNYTARLYELKGAKVTVAEPTTTQPELMVQSPSSSSLTETTHKKLITSLAMLLLFCLVILFISSRFHNQVALRLQHGKVFLEGSEGNSHQEFSIQVEPDIQRIRVVNINGRGRVSIYLSPSPDYQEAMTGVDDWSFKWRDDEYLYMDVPLTHLQPGRYYLHFVQEAGWGYFEYIISQGGGTWSYITAFIIGFLLACSLILGLGLILLGPARHLI